MAKKRKVLVNTDNQYTTRRTGKRATKTKTIRTEDTGSTGATYKNKTKVYSTGRKAGTEKRVGKMVHTDFKKGGSGTTRTRSKTKGLS